MDRIIKKIKKLLSNLSEKDSTLNKVLKVIGPFMYVLQIFIIIFMFILLIYTTSTLLKGLMGCVIIIMLLILRKSHKLIKTIRKEIGSLLDNSKVKKDLIYYLMLYTFIMLITANISLFVFFWLQYYFYSTIDPFEMKESLKYLFNIVGWNKIWAFYIRILIVIGTVIVLYKFIIPNIKDKGYKNSNKKRTEEDKLIDKNMIYFARQMPKISRQLLYYNKELNVFIFLSMFIVNLNIHNFINLLGLFLFLLFIILKIYSAYYRTKFEKRLYDFLWYISYKPNPDPDVEKLKRYVNRYKRRVKRVVYLDSTLKPSTRMLRNIGISGVAVWGSIVVGQWSWDMIFDSEKNMYPPKKVTRYIGIKIKDITGYPKNID